MTNAALMNSAYLNIELLEQEYALYKDNPASVDSSWQHFFEGLEKSSSPLPVPESSSTPSLAPGDVAGHSVLYYPKLEMSSQNSEWRVRNLIDSYRTYGHLWAATNPISPQQNAEPEQLKLENLGFTKQDLPLHFVTCGLLKVETAPLLDIINALKAIYCDKIGIEYMGIQNPEIRQWLQDRIEANRFKELSIEQKQTILKLLNKSELLELFLHTRFVGQKRFSLEGAETLIPMLSSTIDKGAALSVEEYIIGMAHRGRLNVLCNIFDKSYSEVFSEFEEGYIPITLEGSGDVKYHKGFYSEVKTIHGHNVKLTLTPNPSHLESVDPVVEGQVRARQIICDDDEQAKIIAILIHGDAAISGQGVVYETLQLSKLDGYSTGGTLHFVINNQIGFTTVPKDARSTLYCTDIAKIFDAPVFHVNAEDPESCVYIAELAIELRQKFHCDVFIELNCYRKYGHNESDEPAYTQPLEYQIIRKKLPIRDQYRDILIQQGVVEKQLAENLEIEFKASLQEALNAKTPQKQEPQPHKPSASAKLESLFRQIDTGVPFEILQKVGQCICFQPPGFIAHPKLINLHKDRLAMLSDSNDRKSIDWGMAELLAYGSLLWEGSAVRLSGQDCCRGTFSHRHAMLMDQEKEQEYIPLKHLKEEQGRFDIYNSPLSEFAVLGFEFGYSVVTVNSLVIWEAQFGDFANGAQTIIDQFIAPAEQKWDQKSALTLFLPHGYEGQGPEHSSARIERFLNLSGENNIQVVYPTTPAQFFHLLRRQVLRPEKKPLIVFTPKGLLRHPACVSSLHALTEGCFHEVLEDPNPPRKSKRLILCSGRIFYDLIEARSKAGTTDTTIIRIEQLYPLDVDGIKQRISKCSGLKECLWVQEEPANMGAWSFIRPVLRDMLPKSVDFSYVGRSRSAATAVGSHEIHKREHKAILETLFDANPGVV